MAPSKESGALKELFETFAANFPQDDNLFLERAIYDQIQNAATEPLGVHYESGSAGGRPCLWIRPEGASSKHAMLFLHGGGYSFGSPASHRKLAGHLAQACHVPALSVDYRRSPEHPFPTPLDDCVNAYAHLLERGIPAAHVVVAGDSCGGGLATAVPLACRQRGLPVPGAAVSLSPYYDATCFDGTMDSNAARDAINSKPFLHKLADRYTAGRTELRRDPLVSPLYAEMAGLPPHWISCAGCDMLLDQGTRLAGKLEKAGVEVVLEVHEGQQHVFEFMAGNAPEADESIRKIGEWVRRKIGS